MPNFKTHSTVGAGLSICSSVIANSIMPGTEILMASCAMFGSLFPDTDTASKSRVIIYWVFLLISITFIIFKMYILSAFLGILAMLPAISYHRGWTHSLFGALFISFLISFVVYFVFPFGPIVLLSFLSTFSGIIIHIILDKIF